MKIDIRGDGVLYVTIGDWTYYIDDGTNEQIMERWKNNSEVGIRLVEIEEGEDV